MFGRKKNVVCTPSPLTPCISTVEDWHVARAWNITPAEWNSLTDTRRREYREQIAYAPGPNARVTN